MVNMIADENELRWFFNHVIFPLQPYESYSAVLVSRHKKLTEEEKVDLGMTRKVSEFLKVETIRKPPFRDCNQPDTRLPFETFLQHIYRLNFDDKAYVTGKGLTIPTKTLAVIFYVNPCDDIKVWDATVEELDKVKAGLIKGMINGKQADLECKQSYQAFGNVINTIKHYKASCKGSVYWMDYDIDVPSWWKNIKEKYDWMWRIFFEKFGKGNYIIIDTSGGYHVLVKTNTIHFDPHIICQIISNQYIKWVKEGEEPYVDKDNVTKFECIINDSQIPGIPLPGTYQYQRGVSIINKEDFE